MRLIQSHGEVLQSQIHWPFTRAGTAVMLAINMLLVGFTILGLELCDQSESCSSKAWPESVFGKQRTFWRNDEARTTRGWCELQEADVLMEQESNALSNLGFCGFGMIVVACGLADLAREKSVFPVLTRRSPAYGQDGEFLEHARRNHITTFPLLSFIYGLSSTFLGIGSFMMHSYSSDLTQLLDVGGIFVALAVPMHYSSLFFLDVNAPRARILVARAAVVLAILVTDFLMVYYKWEIKTNMAMIGMILVIVLMGVGSTCVHRSRHLEPNFFSHQVEWRFRGWLYLALGGLSLALGFTCWQLDVRGIWCSPNSFLQGHSLWHLFCALALFCTYFFLRSEVTLYAQDTETSAELQAVDSKAAQNEALCTV